MKELRVEGMTGRCDGSAVNDVDAQATDAANSAAVVVGAVEKLGIDERVDEIQLRLRRGGMRRIGMTVGIRLAIGAFVGTVIGIAIAIVAVVHGNNIAVDLHSVVSIWRATTQ